VDATAVTCGHDGPVTEHPPEAHEEVPPELPAPPPELPPDPVAYDSPRAERARAKGLKGPYIAGGDDPDIAAARAEERRLWRILLAMVVVIVSAGFVIGIVLALIPPGSGG
jgi:hypothetical protein